MNQGIAALIMKLFLIGVVAVFTPFRYVPLTLYRIETVDSVFISQPVFESVTKNFTSLEP